jgi:hypothetical protein
MQNRIMICFTFILKLVNIEIKHPLKMGQDIIKIYKGRSVISMKHNLFQDSCVYLPDDIQGNDLHKTSCFLNTKISPSCMKKRPQDMKSTLKVSLKDFAPFLKKLKD